MFFSKFGFFLGFFSQVCRDFFLLLLFLLFSLLDDEHSVFVALDDLLVDFGLLNFFSFNFLLFLSFEFFHFLEEDLSLSLLFFSGFESFDLSELDLIDDDLFSFEGFDFFALLNFLLFFDFFESFEFHDFVFFLLLDFVIFPLSFLLFELSFSDGGSFGIGYHFIHLLNIIEFLLRDFDCLLVDLFFLLGFFPFDIIQRDVFLFLFFQFEHLLSFGFGKGKLVLLLLFSKFLFKLLFLLAWLTDHVL